MEAGDAIPAASERRRWLDEELADWSIGRNVARALFAGPILVAALAAMSVVHRPLYAALVEEDGVFEWLQVAVLAGILVAALAIGRRLWRDGERAAGAFFLLGAAGAAFIIGEEISWGQRIFGWATPEHLEALNRQGETNIHNIGNVLRAFNLVVLTVALWAIVGPLAWRQWAGSRERRGAEILFVPPLFLVSGFAITATYRLIRLILIPEGRYVVNHYQEVSELIFYAGILALLVLILRRLRRASIAA